MSELPKQMLDVLCLWMHGQTHTRFDYKVGDCRVVCHPCRYRRSHGGFEADFDPKLVIEIPEGRASAGSSFTTI